MLKDAKYYGQILFQRRYKIKRLQERRQSKKSGRSVSDRTINFRARNFKRLWNPGIESKEWIPPAYVAWRAGTITLFLLGF